MQNDKSPAANRRATLIKLIHVAKRELCLDEPTYRTILLAVGKSESLSAMSVPNMITVLDHLKKQGFQVRSRAGDRTQATSAFARKVRALWLFLHTLDVVRDPSERALNAYVKRIAKVDDVRWVKSHDQEIVIETLKKWAMRFLPATLPPLQREVIDRLCESAIQMHEIDLAHLIHMPGSDEGFDAHWWAWERFTGFLNRPTPCERGVFGEERVNV